MGTPTFGKYTAKSFLLIQSRPSFSLKSLKAFCLVKVSTQIKCSSPIAGLECTAFCIKYQVSYFSVLTSKAGLTSTKLYLYKKSQPHHKSTLVFQRCISMLALGALLRKVKFLESTCHQHTPLIVHRPSLSSHSLAILI